MTLLSVSLALTSPRAFSLFRLSFERMHSLQKLCLLTLTGSKLV
jgi:hypothetical protein